MRSFGFGMLCYCGVNRDGVVGGDADIVQVKATCVLAPGKVVGIWLGL